MSRTSILQLPQVLSGSVAPTVPPLDPQSAATFYIIDSLGVFAGESVWNVQTQVWVPVPVGGPAAANWSEFKACGWDGAHNDLRHRLDPAFTTASSNGTLLPVFGVDAPSTSPIPFAVLSKNPGQVIATGVFPAGVRSADAATCGLQDVALLPISSLVLGAGDQIACVPVGGHAAMPADGYGFSLEGRLVYA